MKLGAKAALPVSMTVCKAAADCKGLKLYEYIRELADAKEMCLPACCFNVINGG